MCKTLDISVQTLLKVDCFLKYCILDIDHQKITAVIEVSLVVLEKG